MVGQSFPSRERLKKAAFKAVFEEGRKVAQNSLLLWIAPNSLSYNRVGFSAPRKCFKLSTQRNRVRRMLREAYRRNKERFKPGCDIIIMLRKAEALPEYGELKKALLGLFAKAGFME